MSYSSLPTPNNGFRLHRSSRDKMLGGVCGGLAESFDADPTLVRLLAAVLMLVLNVVSPLVYIVAWVIMPLD